MLKSTENRIRDIIKEDINNLNKELTDNTNTITELQDTISNLHTALQDLLINNGYSVEDIKELISFIKENNIPHIKLKVDNIELEMVSETPTQDLDIETEGRYKNPYNLSDEQIRTASGTGW